MKPGTWGWHLLRAVLGFAVVMIAGCGGGGGGGDGGGEQPPLTGNFFPLAVGDLWIYDDGQGGRATVRATGTASAQGQTGVRVVTEAAGERSEAVYVVTPTAVREVPVAGTDPLLQALGPIDLMRFPLRAGESFVQFESTISSGIDVDGDGRPEPADVRSVVTVVGLETVVTPASSLAGSLHVRTELRADLRLTAMAMTVRVDMVMDDWYAPDLGPVRSTMRLSAEGMVEETTLTAVAWKVGSRRSESTPPAALEFTPAADATQGQTATVRVRFDEPLDPASAAGALAVRDAGGSALAGTVDVGIDSVTFWPAVPLTSGRYTARLAPTVADLLGNAAGGAREWSFTIDAAGPQLVAVTPAVGALDMPRDTVITLRYDEALDPTSLTAAACSLRPTFGSDVPITLAIVGNTMTFTPQAPLARGTEYTLTIGNFGYGPRDVYGNWAASGPMARFTTDPGRFEAPQALPPSQVTAEAVAIGDVDGDGRADVIVAAGPGSDPAYSQQVGIYRQQADGTLGAPQWIAPAPGVGCRPTSIAVGDVDGNGRQDVVVAHFGCGIQLLLQDAAGTLQPGPFLPSAQSYQVRLADFDGDGRLDLLAVGWSDTAARLWLQTAGGTLVEAGTPAIETQGWGMLAVGDLDGDGRTDFAITSGQGDRAKALGVVLQRADGNFAPPQYVAGTRIGGLFPGLAIGDVDGDGRAELLAAIDDAKIGVWRIEAGTLVRVRDLPAAESAGPMALRDVNGDGRLDLLVLHTGGGLPGLRLRLQQPGGVVGPETRYAAFAPYTSGEVMAIGDLNADGRPDLLLGSSVLLQRSVPAFAESVRVPGAMTRLLQRAAGGAVPH